MTIPPVPRWLVPIGMAGNLLAGIMFHVQGNPVWALFALGLGLNIFTLIKGGRTTDPLPIEPDPEPEALTDAYYKQLRADTLAERAKDHAVWDAAYRKLCPPEPGVVWRRTIHKITDFNN